MTPHKQPSSCVTCGLPVPFAGAPCSECTALTHHAGETGGPRAGTSETPPLAPGDVLEGKWRLEGLLGAGGMGQVYRARDIALERTVAIKLLHEALCADPRSVARFEREARAMARLEHAHIAPIHAVGQERGRPFIVMKHLEGMSLSRYLRSLPGPLPVPEVLALARQLCAGLDFIHQRGCVHRDIKPGNIFLSPGGHATLLDFGILWEYRGEDATRSGASVGTPSYMAPEQARGEQVDGRADLFSLGLVLLELLTGLPPASTCRLLGDGPGKATQALRARAPWLPPSLTEVLVGATALNPEQRPSSALALLSALEDAHLTAPTPVPPMASPERGRRGRILARAALGLASVGILVLGVREYRSRTAPAPAPVSSVSTPPAPAPTAPPEQHVATPTPEVPPPTPPPVSEPPPTESKPSVAAASPRPTRRTRTQPPATSTPAAGGVRPRKGVGELRVVTLHQGKAVWANVSVDGKLHGATPVSLELPEGRHSLRVERDGFAPQERPIQVLPGAKAVVRIELHE
ncbi:MAG: serine/threonine-protein kinase [Cystobacter sp.]